MQIKKLFKYLPMAVIAAGLAVAASIPSLSLSNNPDQEVADTIYSDQLQYIRNDVAKQTGVANSVASIKLANSFSVAEHSAAIVTKTDGSTLLYMWGLNQYGQLGNAINNGTSTANPVPTLVTALSGKKIIQVALGWKHSAALLEDGSLYMWGYNVDGQLGFTANGTTPNPIPAKVNSTPFGSKKITEIALAEGHSAALLEDGSLYMWGWNNNGQLGNGTKDNTHTPTLVDVTNFDGKKIFQIALGNNYSAALLEDGSLYTWGLNDYGQLGIGSTATVATPAKVTINSAFKITQIVLGWKHSAALLEDGSLYMWGSNRYGQLGSEMNSGTETPNHTPALVDSTNFGHIKITRIGLGWGHSAALLDDGSLYMWGRNNYGQLGFTANTAANPTPTIVSSTYFSSKIIQIALGNHYSAVSLEDGSLYMWGRNDYGQLGNGSTANASIPTWMSQLGKDSRITAKSAITAKNAVDNLWVDNKFNLDGFKNSFNLVNIPDAAGQAYEIDTKPAYDNIAGTVTMNIKIKYYYDENGLIVANTAANSMLITDFKKIVIGTNITVKTTYQNSLVVDKWEDYVKSTDGKYAWTKLEEFLNLIDVPTDAEFTITNLNPINKTGVLTFNISTSKIIDGNGNVQNTPSIPFPITLDLTARVTKMTPKTSGYPTDLTASELKTKLFNEDGLVIDLTELQKYMTIVAPIDGAAYHLVSDSWNPNEDNKAVKFSIWVDKYYDTEGNVQIGTATSAASRINFDLKLSGHVVPATDDEFPWWWILAGIGGPGIIAVGVWFILKNIKQ